MDHQECPDREKLADYLLGKLPDPEFASVSDHLDHCPVCESTMDQLDTLADGLVEEVRGSPGNLEFSEEPQLRQTLARIRDLCPPSSSASPMQDGGEHRGTPGGEARSPGGPATAEAGAGTSLTPGSQLGAYRIIERLGQGGVGTVYRAVHVQLEKTVALKVLSAEHVNNPAAVARFQREMKAVGAVAHLNIVGATDAGAVDGNHFLVMEYVDGITLTRIVRQFGPLSVPAACEIIRQTALALQAVHEHGLVHRDVKPGNVMLTPQGQIKLLDLGLALLQTAGGTDGELTRTGQVMGTVDYMAPEQLSDAHGVDIRADLYSLGCTLFYLLAGRPPFHHEEYPSLYARLRAHTEQPPPSPTTLRDDIPRSLEKTLKRVLAKDPADRFETPAQLAEALQPYTEGVDLGGFGAEVDRSLAGAAFAGAGLQDRAASSSSALTEIQPAESRTTIDTQKNTFPRWTWAGRRVLTAAAAAGALLLGTVIYFNTGQGQLKLTVNVEDARVTVDDKRPQSVTIDSQRETILIRFPVEAGKHQMEVTKDGFTTVTRQFRVFRHGTTEIEATLEPAGPVEGIRQQNVKGESPGAPDARELAGHTEAVLDVDVSSDGQRLLTAGRDDTLRLWDLQAGKQLEVLEGHQAEVRAVDFSPDGRSALSGSKDQSIRLWDLETGALVRQYTGHVDMVTAVSFAPDGRSFVSSGFDGRIILWDVDVPTPIDTLGYREGEAPQIQQMSDLEKLEAHVTWIRSVQFAPDGQSLISAGNEALVALWDDGSRRITTRLIGHRAPAASAVLSPDGKRALSGGYDNAVRFWNCETGTLIETLTGHRGPVHDVAISADVRRALSAGADGTVRLWDLETGRELETYTHQPAVFSVAFTPEERHAVSGTGDGTVRIWRLPEKD